MLMHPNVVRGVATAELGNSFSMERREESPWTTVLLVGRSSDSDDVTLCTGTPDGLTCIEDAETFVRAATDAGATVRARPSPVARRGVITRALAETGASPGLQVAARRVSLPNADALARETAALHRLHHESPDVLQFASLQESGEDEAAEAPGGRSLARTVLSRVREYLAYPTMEMMVEIFRAFAQADRDGNGRYGKPAPLREVSTATHETRWSTRAASLPQHRPPGSHGRAALPPRARGI